ncbi:MAG TPA: hypothetical protein DCX13_08695 [Rhodobacteraceae bacterium]|jgi:hypothetical protein|nr:hypothetical protein [Paracoccaceae bacterium]
MHRTFIASVLAAALAITGLSSAPAQAGDKDLARFIMGVAAIGVIAAAVNDANRQERRHDDREVSRHAPAPVVIAPERNHHKPHLQPRPLPERARAAVLPGQCLRQVADRRGTRNVFVAGCLERNDVRISRLPQRCELSVVGQRGYERSAFDAGCLANHGYRTARR